jgi:hypothetical protein
MMTFPGPSGGSGVNRSSATSAGRYIRPVAWSTGLLPALLLGLAACGSPSTGEASGPQVATVISAADLCAFMHDELLPTLQQEPSMYSAMMTATSAIAKFYQDHNALQFLATTDLDAATELSCPEVRNSILKAIGQKNLRAVLM